MDTREHVETTPTRDPADTIPLGFGGVDAAVGDHIAHFFRNDAQRFSVLGPYIETGLRQGDRYVLISRPAAGERLCEWLSHRGVDTDDARAADRLILHPGEATEEDMKRLADRIDAEARDEDEPFVRWSGDREWALEQNITVCEMLRRTCYRTPTARRTLSSWLRDQRCISPWTPPRHWPMRPWPPVSCSMPPDVPTVAVEAGITRGWHHLVGNGGAVIGLDRFGLSGPGEEVYEELGFTVDRVVETVHDVLEDTASLAVS